MDDDGTNAILIMAMAALLIGMVWLATVEGFRYQALLATQPVDVEHDNLAGFVGKSVRLLLYTSPKPGVTTSNGQPFACEQAHFLRSRSEDSNAFLPESGLVLTDHDQKLNIVCKQINPDYCTLIFKGRVTEGENMLPKDWQDESKHNNLFVAVALPVNAQVTAIGMLNKTADGYELGPITIPMNRSLKPIVSTLKADTVLTLWMNQVIAPLVLKCGVCILLLLVVGFFYHSRQVFAGARGPL